jgi:hypothetical protein
VHGPPRVTPRLHLTVAPGLPAMMEKALYAPGACPVNLSVDMAKKCTVWSIKWVWYMREIISRRVSSGWASRCKPATIILRSPIWDPFRAIQGSKLPLHGWVSHQKNRLQKPHDLTLCCCVEVKKKGRHKVWGSHTRHTILVRFQIVDGHIYLVPSHLTSRCGSRQNLTTPVLTKIRMWQLPMLSNTQWTLEKIQLTRFIVK